jgi:hypothetical protein
MMKRLWFLVVFALIFGGCTADDVPRASTGRAELPIDLSVNLLANGDFEHKQVTESVWIPANPSVSAWQMSGNRWHQYRPTSNDTWPQSALGAQYLWLGKDADAVPTDAKQRIGTVRPGLRYKVSLRVRPMASISSGTMSLQAFDGESTWHVLAQSSNWSAVSVGAWHELTLEYDTGASPAYQNHALYFVVTNGVSSTLIDNAVVKVSQGTGTNLVSNPGFELNALSPGYLQDQPIPDWTGSGEWYQYNNYNNPLVCYPPPSSNQYIDLGLNTVTLGSLSQVLGTFDAAATYRASARLWRRNAADPGNGFQLVASAPGQPDIVLGSASWASAGTCPPGGVWTHLEFAVDGAEFLAADDRTLKVVLSSKHGAIFDDIVVTADTDRAQAYLPSPPNGATGLHRATTTLGWHAGQYAAPVNGHRVYFSADFDQVTDGTAPSTLRTDPAYNPGTLIAGETYYWRVDELNPAPSGPAPYAWPGPVWSFTVHDGKASNPFPPNGDTNGVSPTELVLRWTGGPYTDPGGHELFLSTNAALVTNSDSSALVGSFAETERAVGPLTPGATYYWRVNEHMGSEVFPGPVWSFKVFSSLGGTFDKGYAVWIANAQNLVFPASRPASYPTNPSAAVELAGGEKESFQVVVLPAPGRVLHRVWIENISGGTSGYPLDETNVDAKVVGYVPAPPLVEGNTYLNAIQPYLDPGKPPIDGGWWPDPLFDLPWTSITSSAHAQPFWITVSGPSTPGHDGNYSGTLKVNTDSGLPTEVNFSVKVHDFMIPPGAGNNQNLFYFYRTGNQFVFNPGEYRQYGGFLLEHRMNPTEGIYDNLTLDGGVVPSSERLGDLQHFHSLGMSRFSVRDARGYAFEPGNPAHREYRKKLRQFFTDLAALPNGAAIREKAMFYAYDEAPNEQCTTLLSDGCQCVSPAWDNFDQMIADFAALEEGFSEPSETPGVNEVYPAYADVKRLTTAHIAAGNVRACTGLLVGDPTWDTDPAQSLLNLKVDGLAINGILYDPADVDALVGEGLDAWSYEPYGTIGQPALDSRTIWWRYFNQKLTGLLYYATNEWLNGRVDPANGIFVNYAWPATHDGGHTVLFYPGTNGPIGSIRLANTRDGLEDFEYLFLYAKKTGDPARARAQAAPVGWGIYPWNSNDDFVPVNTYDSAVVASARESLIPTLIARITTDQSTYPAGTPIVAQFENLTGDQHDWLAIYPKSAPGPGGYLAWKYTDGTTTGTAGIHDGSVTFSVSLPPGEYEMRLFFNDTYLRVDAKVFVVQ